MKSRFGQIAKGKVMPSVNRATTEKIITVGQLERRFHSFHLLFFSV